MDFQDAGDIYMRGTSRMACAAFGGELLKLGKLYRLHLDNPPDAIADEFFMLQIPPKQALDQIFSSEAGTLHRVRVISTETDLATHQLFSAGYRVQEVEYLMQRMVDAEMTLPSSLRTERITTADEVEIINQTAGRLAIVPDLLTHKDWIGMCIQVGGQPACWGQVVLLPEQKAGVIAGIFTVEEYRRRGLAQEVLMALISTAGRAGMKTCVLGSTQMAHPFFRLLAFRDLGEVRVFATDSLCSQCGLPVRKSQCSSCGRSGTVSRCEHEQGEGLPLRSTGVQDYCFACEWRAKR